MVSSARRAAIRSALRYTADMRSPACHALLVALLGLGACFAGPAGKYDTAGVGGNDSWDTGGGDVCQVVSQYLESCGQPTTTESYEACRTELDGIESSCGLDARQGYESSLSTYYSCLSAASYCVGGEMTEAAFQCQVDFSDATAALSSCRT